MGDMVLNLALLGRRHAVERGGLSSEHDGDLQSACDNFGSAYVLLAIDLAPPQ
jgi:hypothetical protein